MENQVLSGLRDAARSVSATGEPVEISLGADAFMELCRLSGCTDAAGLASWLRRSKGINISRIHLPDPRIDIERLPTW